MVTLDPCKRLKTIQTQLIPAILTSARYEIDTLDLKSAIETNLPHLEKTSYDLAKKCPKTWPECGEKVEVCNKERINQLFLDTRAKLEKIWDEKKCIDDIP